MFGKTNTATKPAFMLLGGVSSLPGAAIVRGSQRQASAMRATDVSAELDYQHFRAYGVTPHREQKITTKKGKSSH